MGPKYNNKAELEKKSAIYKAEQISEKFKEALAEVKDKKNVTKKAEKLGEKLEEALTDMKQALDKSKGERAKADR